MSYLLVASFQALALELVCPDGWDWMHFPLRVSRSLLKKQTIMPLSISVNQVNNLFRWRGKSTMLCHLHLDGHVIPILVLFSDYVGLLNRGFFISKGNQGPDGPGPINISRLYDFADLPDEQSFTDGLE